MILMISMIPFFPMTLMIAYECLTVDKHFALIHDKELNNRNFFWSFSEIFQHIYFMC